jgi:hypothetical protein
MAKFRLMMETWEMGRSATIKMSHYATKMTKRGKARFSIMSV